MKEEKKVGVDLGLTEEEKKTLHQIGKTVIENKAKGKAIPDFKIESTTLKENRGAFVTIHKKGQLRGCIGYIEGHGPLYKTIEEMAEAAAFRDPRFTPVKENELPELDLEISVLTPLKRISDVNEIQVGRHGIYIKKGWYSGLLLPQVATEYRWDRQTFLEHTCQKAARARPRALRRLGGRHARANACTWWPTSSGSWCCPGVRVKNLASKVLGANLRRLSAHWHARWGHPIHLAETFVDPTRFRATCYRAANWTYLGQSAGRGKRGHHYLEHGIPKAVFVYELHRRTRALLCAPETR